MSYQLIKNAHRKHKKAYNTKYFKAYLIYFKHALQYYRIKCI